MSLMQHVLKVTWINYRNDAYV